MTPATPARPFGIREPEYFKLTNYDHCPRCLGWRSVTTFLTRLGAVKWHAGERNDNQNETIARHCSHCDVLVSEIIEWRPEEICEWFNQERVVQSGKTLELE